MRSFFQTVQCSQCQTENALTSKYCAECGAKLQAYSYNLIPEGRLAPSTVMTLIGLGCVAVYIAFLLPVPKQMIVSDYDPYHPLGSIERKIIQLRSKISSTYDPMRAFTWHHHSDTPKPAYDVPRDLADDYVDDTRTKRPYFTNCELFFVETHNGRYDLLFRFDHHSNDWLHLKKLIIRLDDKEYSLPVREEDIQRYNNDHDFIENYRIFLTKEQEKVFRSVPTSKNVKFTAHGTSPAYPKTIVTVPDEDMKKRFSEVIEFRDLSREAYWGKDFPE